MVYRLVGIDLDSTLHTEGADSSVILFKEDVEAFVRSLIRIHGRGNPKVSGFQHLLVQFPSVHYAPSSRPEDEASYIPQDAWIGNYPTYDPKNAWGRVFLSSIFLAQEMKASEFYAQSCSHAASCSSDYGGEDCKCEKIDAVPEWIEPYIDPHFKDLFKVNLDVEEERFNEKFGHFNPQWHYQRPSVLVDSWRNK